ncbi:MAG: sodium:proton antiporter [Thermomicrobiales bacterium]|nr:MAG: sodium:proton antiporter [Thermomicrobiales bacterium]
MFDPSELFALELTEQLRFILELGAAVAAALVGGAIAVRLRQPVIIGYLLAGVAIGPFTPGFVGDVESIAVLAEVGVILLLFALGVEFSIKDLRAVSRMAVPGAVAQIAVVLVTGGAVMVGLGFEMREALVVGACLSISSTLVVLKSLVDRGELDSLHGRAAIGWAVVQDIATIVFIVALPPAAGGDILLPFVAAMAKAALFLVLAFVVGTRLLPWVFAQVARLGSSELFLLMVVATALLTAFVSSAIFGLSLALGAFVAGLLISESELSHQAAAEVTPFRDLFAVLFFVSVGMLVDPAALVADAGLVAVLIVIAVGVKGVVTAILGRGLGLPSRSAILLGSLMAQVGEFSFILASDGRELGLLSAQTYNLVLGTAVVSILMSPFVARLASRLVGWVAQRASMPTTEDLGIDPPSERRRTAELSRTEAARHEHDGSSRPTVVVLGAGRVGRVVVNAVLARGFRCVVVDRDVKRLEAVGQLGATTLYGDAANPEILKRVGLEQARVLVVAIGDALTARLATERALQINPGLSMASRVRGGSQIEVLRQLGVRRLADPEAEAAFELARHALQRMGVSGPELSAILTGLRRDVYGRGGPPSV